jgi:hypothetical protein
MTPLFQESTQNYDNDSYQQRTYKHFCQLTNQTKENKANNKDIYKIPILIQISSVSKVSLSTGALKRSDLQAFIRNVYRNKNLPSRTKCREYVAFSTCISSTENTQNNRAHDAYPSVQGEQSMKVSNGVAEELHGKGSMEFLAHELKME